MWKISTNNLNTLPITRTTLQLFQTINLLIWFNTWLLYKHQSPPIPTQHRQSAVCVTFGISNNNELDEYHENWRFVSLYGINIDPSTEIHLVCWRLFYRVPKRREIGVKMFAIECFKRINFYYNCDLWSLTYGYYNIHKNRFNNLNWLFLGSSPKITIFIAICNSAHTTQVLIE